MTKSFEDCVSEILEERILSLRDLTFEQSAELPETSESELTINGTRCGLCVFRQSDLDDLPGAILVTVQISRSHALGLFQTHSERGLVFSANESLREATQLELLQNGG